jgi:hypothetical protein
VNTFAGSIFSLSTRAVIGMAARPPFRIAKTIDHIILVPIACGAVKVASAAVLAPRAQASSMSARLR